MAIFLAGWGKFPGVARNFINVLSYLVSPLELPFCWHSKPFLPAWSIRSANNLLIVAWSLGMVFGLWNHARTRWHLPFIGGPRIIDTSASLAPWNKNASNTSYWARSSLVCVHIKWIQILQTINIVNLEKLCKRWAGQCSSQSRCNLPCVWVYYLDSWNLV